MTSAYVFQTQEDISAIDDGSGGYKFQNETVVKILKYLKEL